MTNAYWCDSCRQLREGEPNRRNSLHETGVIYSAELCEDCAAALDSDLWSIIRKYGMTVDRNLAALHVLAKARGKIEL